MGSSAYVRAHRAEVAERGRLMYNLDAYGSVLGWLQLYINARIWDNHNALAGELKTACDRTDLPIAGLLRDLKQRGLLENTLVVWGGEFGRLPIAQTGQKPGRDHNPHCFTFWLAGAGVKGGVSYGESDEIGYKAAVNRVHINDLHATILHLLGMDHTRLTYVYNGRRFRLTDVAGNVIREVIA